MPDFPRHLFGRMVAGAIALAFAVQASAQITSTPGAETRPHDSPPPETAATQGTLADLQWLAGCWRGSVNQRDFREHWMPLRGDLLVGAGHTVFSGRTQDFEYLRVEPRADGVYYVASPSGRKETAFRLSERTTDGPDTIFTFTNPDHDFPQTIIYRRATGGWLYVHVEGKLAGGERTIIYPFRRVDCETDAFIEQ